MSYYCEMCGREVDARVAKRVVVEGSPLVICPECYSKLSKRVTIRENTVKETSSVQVTRHTHHTTKKPTGSTTSIARIESYEVVENYHQIIRSARERLGWSQEVLASKVGESVNTIRRIESGKLKPTLELARKLERVLKVKLIEPVVVEPSEHRSPGSVEDLTIGDLIDTKRYSEKVNKGSR